MCFTGVEVEQETSAPPPKQNPGSAPATSNDPERKIGMDCTHSTSNYITPPSDPFMYFLIFLISLLL